MAQDYVKGLLSGGEVVLIDTRQHWMAAIRFAMKPILLIGGVILLFLLNQWLRFEGGLSFINDIVSWILIIMIVISIIWLPVDLVRWYSRRYVLTNRRAMRMSGVFRKISFDSSLEQINDIGFSQSVFGRALGYADLTLYTASDTANESYEQLIDGMQFKKAVLDAKEAIRHGAPLQALPEGFIVKGGTNVASMRADGRLEEAAAEVEPMTAESVPNHVQQQSRQGTQPPEPATATGSWPAADTAPAAAVPPAAPPEPVVEPEPAPAPEPVVETTPAPALVVEPEPELAEPEPEPVAPAEPVAESPAEPEPQASADSAAEHPESDKSTSV